jgi:uncharacterized damage-inducible protein DinB
MRKIDKPGEGEYAPYAIMYIGLLPDDGRILDHLRENYRRTKELILSLPAEKLTYRYAAAKWSIKEILLHLSDDERIYAYRALRFARNDATELPGFEQDDYAAVSGADARSAASLLRELGTVRRATLSLFAGLDEDALLRAGVANGHRMSVRAAAYHIAGHELHHIDVIRKRYLQR